jgi:unsaturated rhamnogalacturonyl hydrolase
MPAISHDIPYSLVRSSIDKLIDNLIHISDDSGEFLLELDDGRVIDTKGWNDWQWTHGMGLYSLFKDWTLTGDEKAKDIIESWFSERLAEGTPSKNADTVAPFLTMAFMQERTGNLNYLTYMDVWAEWIMRDMPRTEEGGLQHITYVADNNQQLWANTLMMTVLPLAKIGLLLDRPHYVEEAKRQFILHGKYLIDRKTGLWFHGWTFDGRHNFADAHWARGNSWITIAILDFVEMLDLPETDSLRMFLIETLESQIKALAKMQNDNGLWHTLLDDPDSYLESSASAGFAYSILKAVRKGYIDKKYEEVGTKAIKAILDDISEDGELQQVSFGTPVYDDLQQYKDVPITSMPHGQSMAILACVEYLNRYI